MGGVATVMPVDGPTADMMRVVKGFLSSVAESESGKRVLKDVRYNCDCFGFPVFIRKSTYYSLPSCPGNSTKADRDLEMSLLLCIHFSDSDGEGCLFEMRIRALPVKDENKKELQGTQFHVLASIIRITPTLMRCEGFSHMES